MEFWIKFCQFCFKIKGGLKLLVVTVCTSEFYFEGSYTQDGDGDIVFVAISQTIYVFCESSSLELDWSRV